MNKHVYHIFTFQHVGKVQYGSLSMIPNQHCTVEKITSNEKRTVSHFLHKYRTDENYIIGWSFAIAVVYISRRVLIFFIKGLKLFYNKKINEQANKIPCIFSRFSVHQYRNIWNTFTNIYFDMVHYNFSKLNTDNEILIDMCIAVVCHKEDLEKKINKFIFISFFVSFFAILKGFFLC